MDFLDDTEELVVVLNLFKMYPYCKVLTTSLMGICVTY